jgi:acylphosphatase
MVVEGMVQGVGFRQFAQSCARRRGVVGYAMNLPDGNVRVVAEATRQVLETFAGDLQRGPRLGRVDRLNVTWHEARGEFAGFGIRYHGNDA